MPTVYTYLDEEEYLDLAELAKKRGVKVSALVREAVRRLLEAGAKP
jgi:post-segregation antitoxin (ccd killing protein)